MFMLFVGNSHLLVGDVPKQLKEIVKKHGIKMEYENISKRGSKLSDLKNEAVELISTKKFDYIVLQDQTSRPLDDNDGFVNDIRFLCDAAHKSGAKPVLYSPSISNHNRQPNEEIQHKLTVVYKQIATENNAILVNAGETWVMMYKESPNASLYAEDGFHANNEGAFLTASTFACVLLGIH